MRFRYLLSLIPFGFAIIFGVFWKKEAKIGQQSLSWPSTIASIKNANSNRKHISVTYSYFVDAKEFTGHRIEYCTIGNRDLKDFFRANLLNKKQIKIFYSPSDHSQSVIIPGMGDREIQGYFIVFVGIVISAFAVILIYRRHFKQRIQTEQDAAANP